MYVYICIYIFYTFTFLKFFKFNFAFLRVDILSLSKVLSFTIDIQFNKTLFTNFELLIIKQLLKNFLNIQIIT